MPDILDVVRGIHALQKLKGFEASKRKPKTLGGYALHAASVLGRPFLSALGEVGEAFSAPGMALSEGYGAYEAGKPILKAAARGFTEPLEKARYPSFGERIVPEEEGEGLARKAGRLVAELATDPTMYVGPGAVKAVGKGVVKGAKFLAGTKAAAAIGRSAASQQLARHLLPSTEYLKIFGKSPRLAKGVEAVEHKVSTTAGKEIHGFAEKLKEFGLGGGGKAAVAKREAVYDVIESGQRSGDKAVDSMAEWLAPKTQELGLSTEEFRDLFGKPITQQRPLSRKEMKVIKQYAVDLGLAKRNKPISTRNMRLAFEDFAADRGGAPGSGGMKWIGKRMGKFWVETPFEMLGPKQGGLAAIEKAAALAKAAGKEGPAGYMPQYLAEEYAKQAATKRGLGQTAKNLSRQLGITEEEAAQILKEQTGRIKRAGHIEYTRQNLIPKEMLERDIAKIFPRYVSETVRRKAIGSEFGLGMKIVTKELQKAVTAGLDKESAKAVRNLLQGKHMESKWGLEGMAPWMLGMQTMTKMGPTSTISQFSQSINTIVREGLMNFLRGTIAISTDPAMRQRAIEGLSGQVSSQLARLAGTNGLGDLLGRYGAGQYLRVTGFSLFDRLARILAYGAGNARFAREAEGALKAARVVNSAARDMPLEQVSKLAAGTVSASDELVESVRRSGIMTPIEIGVNRSTGERIVFEGKHRLDAARRLGMKSVPVREVEITPEMERLLRMELGSARTAGYIVPNELAEIGVTAKHLAEFAKSGKWGTEAEQLIGEAASRASQFATKWTDLPISWQSPEMKLATQFKSFIHQQTRFLVRDVVQPAAKYFETGGKEGNIGPLMRALVAYPVAGQGVAALRDLLHEMSIKATGAKRREPRKFDYNHPVAQMLEDSFYVGAFGLGGDVLQQAARGRLIPWSLGPTVSDVAENVQFVARHAAAGKLPKTEALLSRLYRHVPGRRVLPLEPGEAAGAISRAFR